MSANRRPSHSASIGNTALAFTWWNLSLQRLSAVESAGINNTMLIQIGLLAWVFLDEAPGASRDPLGLARSVTHANPYRMAHVFDTHIRTASR